jgi:SprA family protein
MMQAVSQSYIPQAYIQVQNGSMPSANRTEPGKTAAPLYSPPSQQSTDAAITLSAEGKQLSEKQNNTTQFSNEGKIDQTTAGDNKKGQGLQALTQEELKAISELHKRDTEVRSHEQAHLSAAGQYAAGGASFSYTTGPDGKRYANGGEVPIDIGKEKTPEATIQKMRTVRRAALAPANPSSTDRSIAAQASAKEAQAMKELQKQSELSSVDTNSSEGKKTERVQESHSPDVPEKSGSYDSSSKPQVSDFSRRSMTSAYQAVAALAS